MSARLVIISLFLVLVVGAGIFAVTNKDASRKQTDASPVPQAESTATTSPSPGAGMYLDYHEKILDQTSGQRVLFFYAPWCPQCRSIEKGIKAEGVPLGFTIIKVDYDSHQDLRRKYGVTMQTTFVKVDANGNSIGKYNGYDEPTFAAVKRNFLEK